MTHTIIVKPGDTRALDFISYVFKDVTHRVYINKNAIINMFTTYPEDSLILELMENLLLFAMSKGYDIIIDDTLSIQEINEIIEYFNVYKKVGIKDFDYKIELNDLSSKSE